MFSILKISAQRNQGSNLSGIDSKASTDINIDLDVKKKKKTPKLIVTAYTRRHPEFYLFNALFLIFLITASALTVFSIAVKLPANRLQTTYTILLSSISFKWVINRSLPPVSYLTLLDKYSIVCILYINVLAAYHGIMGSFFESFPVNIDFWMLIGFVAAFAIIQIVFYFWYLVVSVKSRKLQKEEKKFIASCLEKNQKEKLLENEDEDEDD